MTDKSPSDPALIQSDAIQPSLGSAPPSSSLSASQRIREIKAMGFGCVRTPTAPCSTRGQWCIGCIVLWLLQRSDQDAETIAKLTQEIDRLKLARELLHRERDGEVWIWQGDRDDHPESLACPVLMHAEDVRAFVADRAALAAARQELEVERDKVGELLQSVSARASEARQAREAMQSLDVFYAASNPPRREGHDSTDWIARVAAEIRDLNPDYHDFEVEVTRMIHAAFTADLAAARLRATSKEQDDEGSTRVDGPLASSAIVPQPPNGDK